MSLQILPIAASASRSVKQIVSVERVRDVLDYDPLTGVFNWRVNTSKRIRIGHVAGTIGDSGYILICIDGRDYRAHRLAWIYVTGEWPSAHIDHINGVRHDNRIANLREATVSQNMQNLRGARRDNLSTGELGVCWDRSHKKYQAKIHIDGKTKHLGRFSTIEAAVAARAAAEAELFPFSTRLKEATQ